jgi:shikimate dehydrogenase
MHNKAFSHTGYDGIYVAFQVKDVASAVSGIRALGIKGVSVTIPHKVSIISKLDDLDEAARQIGAVNTIVRKGNLLIGHNTDSYGAVAALEEKTDLEGKGAAIIGAGGAARSIAFGLKNRDVNVTIVNRTIKKGEQLAIALGTDFQPLLEFHKGCFDILVNTTPLGMVNYSDRMPVSKDVLEKDMVVMDIVYNPLKTQLLTTAESRGCTIVDGLAMFVYQGACQFELWTGIEAPVPKMRKAVLEALEYQS